MDPRHELLAAGNRPADAELEGKEELLEQPALLGKDQPRPDDDGSRRDAACLALGRFPILYDLGDEARLAGLGFLIEDLGAAVTVVADRRLPDEDIGFEAAASIPCRRLRVLTGRLSRIRTFA